MKTYLKFYQIGCTPCGVVKNMLTKVLNDEKKIVNNSKESVLEEGKIHSLDIEQNTELVEKYSVMSVPTIITLEDGEEVDRFIGFNLPKIREIVTDLNGDE